MSGGMSSLNFEDKFLPDLRNFTSAFDSYKPIIRQMARGRSVLEIGAGRYPLFSRDELETENITYSANDVDQGELDAMVYDVDRHVFDVCKEVPTQCVGKFDVIFSKMVQEHLRDTLSFYRNISMMLKPGGIALNFHPVLYAFPFIINKHMPETLSSRLLQFFRKHRNKHQSPKFPAFYDCCVISETVRQKIRATGFSDVQQFAFYGHPYYDSLPIVRSVHRRFTDYTIRKDLSVLATFSYTVCTKAPRAH